MTNRADSHPISLENLLFTKCIVEAVSGYSSGGQESPPPSNNIEVKPFPDRQNVWVATMRTVVNSEKDKQYPYHVDMECMAIIHSDESLDDATSKRGVLITAHSVLYGAIRETVAWLTGRQPYGPLLLGLSILQTHKPKETES